MNWWTILFEMLGLCFLGFLYYHFQKKRILRNFELDLDYVTEQVLLHVSEAREKQDYAALKSLENKMDQLKKDRVTFLQPDELEALLEDPSIDLKLKETLILHQNILLNIFKPNQKKS